jgi:hypothetical protein
MPLALAEHPHEKIGTFLWGLLPDNEGVLTDGAVSTTFPRGIPSA